MDFSIIERNPLAPVPLLIANSAIFFNASFSNSNSTPSIESNSLYCFTIAFFGSVKIRTKSSSNNGLSVTRIGNLPISSGIKPYFTRSYCSTCDKSAPSFFLSEIFAENPIELYCSFFPIIFSIPSNAPPQINKIFEVSSLVV